MEEALASACSPCPRGTITLIGENKVFSFLGAFNAGDQTISKVFPSLTTCISWIQQMQASLEGGQLKKGLKVIEKKIPGATAPEMNIVSAFI